MNPAEESRGSRATIRRSRERRASRGAQPRKTLALVTGVLVIGALALIPLIPPRRRYLRIERM